MREYSSLFLVLLFLRFVVCNFDCCIAGFLIDLISYQLDFALLRVNLYQFSGAVLVCLFFIFLLSLLSFPRYRVCFLLFGNFVSKTFP